LIVDVIDATTPVAVRNCSVAIGDAVPVRDPAEIRVDRPHVAVVVLLHVVDRD